MFYEGKNFSKVYIDTSSVMRYQFDTFMRSFISELNRNHSSLIVPQAVMNELRHIAKKEYTKRSSMAERALENIKALASVGVVVFRGNPNDKERPDSYLMREALSARAKGEKILIITQDSDLMRDLLALNSIKSTFAPALNVLRINNSGDLEKFDLSESSVHNRNNYFKPKAFKGTAEVLKRFGIC